MKKKIVMLSAAFLIFALTLSSLTQAESIEQRTKSKTPIKNENPNNYGPQDCVIDCAVTGKDYAFCRCACFLICPES